MKNPSEKAEQKRLLQRKYAQANPVKIAETQIKYWSKKLAEAEAQ